MVYHPTLDREAYQGALRGNKLSCAFDKQLADPFVRCYCGIHDVRAPSTVATKLLQLVEIAC